MENLDPPTPPPPPPPPPQKKINDGKMTRFPFRWASFLIWGDGGLLFHFILSKIVGLEAVKRYFYTLLQSVDRRSKWV